VDTGRHHAYPTAQPLANLFLGMLDRFGAPQPAFGSDGVGILPNVFV
jgi:hypothetical protein